MTCFVFFWGLTACTSEPARTAPDSTQIVFRGDPASPDYGNVDVFPVDRSALAAFGRSNPRAEDWHRVLTLSVGDSAALPMLGTYSIRGETLRFTPRFPPAPRAKYVARYSPQVLTGQSRGQQTWIYVPWVAPAPDGRARTIVEAVYPSANELPMNLLRMYVHFSAPMSTGKAYDYIKLYAEGESLIPEPFFTAGGMVELWDPEKTRLTILFDPGRIKRDLRPREELGLPLQTGKRYRLVIDSTWPDAQGRAMVRHHVKHFRVGPQDRSLIRTNTWAVLAPTSGARDSLVLRFPEALDRALLQRLLTVRDSSGAAVEGAITISRNETLWSFTPERPWKPVAHLLVVDTELEDLAGNSLKKLFDVSPGDSAGVDAPAVRLRFTPR